MRDGYVSGKGRAVFGYGGMYEGDWAMGFPSGYGKGVTRSGVKYEGEVRDGLAHGQGKAILRDGTEYEGEFDRGCFIGDKIYQNRSGWAFKTTYGVIKRGYSKAKVKSKLGSPHSISSDNDMEVWYYDFGPNQKLYIYFVGDEVFEVKNMKV